MFTKFHETVRDFWLSQQWTVQLVFWTIAAWFGSQHQGFSTRCLHLQEYYASRFLYNMATYLTDCMVHLQKTTHNPITKNCSNKGTNNNQIHNNLMEGLPQKILATVNRDADRDSSYILDIEQVLVLVTLIDTTQKT